MSAAKGEPAFPCRVRIPVQWGDVDRMQHVNNVVFFKWMETTRTRYFEELGLERLVPEGCYPILASIRADYRAQLRYPDEVSAECSVSKLGRTSCTHVYRVMSVTRGEVVTVGEGTWVLFDYRAQTPVPLPDALVSAIEGYEGTVFSRAPRV